MWPIAFWILGILSLAAALLVLVHRRPQSCVLALMALLFIDGIELFLIGAPLLAVELVVVALGGVAVAWLVLVRRRLETIGPPGRARYTPTKLAALAVLVWLALELGSLMLTAPPKQAVPLESTGSAVLGGGTSIFLLGTALACLVAVARNRKADEEERR